MNIIKTRKGKKGDRMEPQNETLMKGKQNKTGRRGEARAKTKETNRRKRQNIPRGKNYAMGKKEER